MLNNEQKLTLRTMVLDCIKNNRNFIVGRPGSAGRWRELTNEFLWEVNKTTSEYIEEHESELWDERHYENYDKEFWGE